MASVLAGIRRYAHTQKDWHLFTSPSILHGGKDLAPTLRSLCGWKGDGVIAAANEENELRSIREMGIPAVNLSAALSESFGVPRVLVNNIKAGRLAADHLLSRGLRHLAYLGRKDLWFSEQRYLGFSQRAAEAGIDCQSLLQMVFGRSQQSWRHRINHIAKWTASLPRPVGSFRDG